MIRKLLPLASAALLAALVLPLAPRGRAAGSFQESVTFSFDETKVEIRIGRATVVFRQEDPP